MVWINGKIQTVPLPEFRASPWFLNSLAQRTWLICLVIRQSRFKFSKNTSKARSAQIQSFTTRAMLNASNQGYGRKIMDSDCGELYRHCGADLLRVQPLCGVSRHWPLGPERNRLTGCDRHAGACGAH